VIATADGTVRIRGVKKAIKLKRVTRDRRRRRQRDPQAQAEGRQAGVRGGIRQDQAIEELDGRRFVFYGLGDRRAGLAELERA
jgi:hypothetical protein